MSKNFDQSKSKKPSLLARRELISKYGANTAPVLVSLLCPAKAYSDFGPGGTVYSTSSACQADTAANAGDGGLYPFHGGGGLHCMVGGVPGGAATHMVINTMG